MKKNISKGWLVFATWLIDVSKYLMTGVVLSTVFTDIESRALLYVVSGIICAIMLIFGIVIKNQEK
ncbi:MAG: hypothetical protein LBQ31_05975 [Bacteroidales bacterium]|jgi:hypothetical protein|nr:hypothetical protein [Bacteroidales bacterium]